jgi:hypothetical protein
VIMKFSLFYDTYSSFERDASRTVCRLRFRHAVPLKSVRFAAFIFGVRDDRPR